MLKNLPTYYAFWYPPNFLPIMFVYAFLDMDYADISYS